MDDLQASFAKMPAASVCSWPLLILFSSSFAVDMFPGTLAWPEVDHPFLDLRCLRVRNMALDDETFAKYKSQLAPA